MFWRGKERTETVKESFAAVVDEGKTRGVNKSKLVVRHISFAVPASCDFPESAENCVSEWIPNNFLGLWPTKMVFLRKWWTRCAR